MNKYQEALENVIDTFVDLSDLEFVPYVTNEDIEALRELVDKAIPKKPIEEINSYDDIDFREHYCPNCKREVDETHCTACGQKIDWSE